MNPSRCWEGKNQEGLRSQTSSWHRNSIWISSAKKQVESDCTFSDAFFKPFIMTNDVVLSATTQEQLRTHGTNTRGNQTFAPLSFHSLPEVRSIKSWRYSILSYLVWSLSYPIIPIYLSTNLPVCLSVFLSYLSVYLSICLSIYLSIYHPSIHLSTFFFAPTWGLLFFLTSRLPLRASPRQRDSNLFRMSEISISWFYV